MGEREGTIAVEDQRGAGRIAPYSQSFNQRQYFLVQGPSAPDRHDHRTLPPWIV